MNVHICVYAYVPVYMRALIYIHIINIYIYTHTAAKRERQIQKERERERERKREGQRETEHPPPSKGGPHLKRALGIWKFHGALEASGCGVLDPPRVWASRGAHMKESNKRGGELLNLDPGQGCTTC